ncbi:MAG: DUF4294 domain-containing protein [Bacteroidia bacterium]|jgi:hypothetical protein|nr:DUF4294 domain-containing protein [Bacteroidia bacterium]
MKPRKPIGLLALMMLVSCFLNAQTGQKAQVEARQPAHQYKLPFKISENGDTIPVVNLRLVNISAERNFASSKEKRQWSRLKRDVAKVYPYSKLASQKLREYNSKMVGMSQVQQKIMLRQAEKELMSEFEDDIRGMTMNQGRILIKLIDRETGNTSYSLVEELRGAFQAFFWQSIARLFGANLKTAYNPFQNKEDRLIEDIITSIEDGTFVN